VDRVSEALENSAASAYGKASLLCVRGFRFLQ